MITTFTLTGEDSALLAVFAGLFVGLFTGLLAGLLFGDDPADGMREGGMRFPQEVPPADDGSSEASSKRLSPSKPEL